MEKGEETGVPELSASSPFQQVFLLGWQTVANETMQLGPTTLTLEEKKCQQEANLGLCCGLASPFMSMLISSGGEPGESYLLTTISQLLNDL